MISRPMLLYHRPLRGAQIPIGKHPDIAKLICDETTDILEETRTPECPVQNVVILMPSAGRRSEPHPGVPLLIDYNRQIHGRLQHLRTIQEHR